MGPTRLDLKSSPPARCEYQAGVAKAAAAKAAKEAPGGRSSSHTAVKIIETLRCLACDSDNHRSLLSRPVYRNACHWTSSARISCDARNLSPPFHHQRRRRESVPLSNYPVGGSNSFLQPCPGPHDGANERSGFASRCETPPNHDLRQQFESVHIANCNRVDSSRAAHSERPCLSPISCSLRCCIFCCEWRQQSPVLVVPRRRERSPRSSSCCNRTGVFSGRNSPLMNLSCA